MVVVIVVVTVVAIAIATLIVIVVATDDVDVIEKLIAIETDPTQTKKTPKTKPKTHPTKNQKRTQNLRKAYITTFSSPTYTKPFQNRLELAARMLLEVVVDSRL